MRLGLWWRGEMPSPEVRLLALLAFALWALIAQTAVALYETRRAMEWLLPSEEEEEGREALISAALAAVLALLCLAAALGGLGGGR